MKEERERAQSWSDAFRECRRRATQARRQDQTNFHQPLGVRLQEELRKNAIKKERIQKAQGMPIYRNVICSSLPTSRRRSFGVGRVKSVGSRLARTGGMRLRLEN